MDPRPRPSRAEPRDELDRMIAAGAVRPPRSPYRRPTAQLTLPPGHTTADLLDRADRL